MCFDEKGSVKLVQRIKVYILAMAGILACGQCVYAQVEQAKSTTVPNMMEFLDEKNILCTLGCTSIRGIIYICFTSFLYIYNV